MRWVFSCSDFLFFMPPSGPCRSTARIPLALGSPEVVELFALSKKHATNVSEFRTKRNLKNRLLWRARSRDGAAPKAGPVPRSFRGTGPAKNVEEKKEEAAFE